MSEEEWELVDRVSGGLQGEILRGLLEANGIPVLLSQEGAGRAYGLTVGALGEVQILVPSSKKSEAEQLLQEYYAGDIEEIEEVDEEDEKAAEDPESQE
jgi:hypothetical protein